LPYVNSVYTYKVNKNTVNPFIASFNIITISTPNKGGGVKMAAKKKLAKAEDVDAVLDEMKIPKGKARDKAKSYCVAKLNSAEGKCLPTEELTVVATSFFDGYSESLRGG
jgi:hypothetical protein